jgi:aminoglycoside phosphotransferase (APT) family kinase protein
MEQWMPGGRNNGAMRVGQTVRRRAGAHTKAVHALLRHLEAVGFAGAPRVVGIDDHGWELLTYLDGDTVGDARPWPAWAHSDAALVATGQWLREFHAASRSFVPPSGAQWFGDHNDVRAGELIGHHDAAPYNAVWRAAPTASDPSHGELVGFIDWDLAGPAKPVRDLAFVALTWVPLTARDVAAADGFSPRVERSRRLDLLLGAYEWSGTVGEVLIAVRHRALEHAVGLRAAADAGYGPAVALVAEGVADSFDRAVAELDASMEDLLHAAPQSPQSS